MPAWASNAAAAKERTMRSALRVSAVLTPFDASPQARSWADHENTNRQVDPKPAYEIKARAQLGRARHSGRVRSRVASGAGSCTPARTGGGSRRGYTHTVP